VINDTLDSTLNKYITKFPSFDQIHKFEYELIDIILGVDKIRKSLGSIDWVRKQVKNLYIDVSKKIGKIHSMNDYSKLEELRRMFYGRTTSLVKQVSNELDFLNSSRYKMRQLPTIDPNLKTIVVAGFPNVGKSQLVRKISTGEPVVAKYPFTTKELNIGHLKFKYQKIQVIDTPGLLDRNPQERNKIEHQAIMALRYLADLIIFILDPTEHCGYSIEDQYKLLSEIKRLFDNVDTLTVENKVDINSSDTDIIKISAETGAGLEVLMDYLKEYFLKDSDSQMKNYIDGLHDEFANVSK
jgi:nucleolar GTP-binding protein